MVPFEGSADGDSVNGGQGSDVVQVNQPASTIPAGTITPDHLAIMAPAVVQTIQNHPEIPGQSKMAVAASILDTMAQFMGPAFQVTRASPRTQAEVALGTAAIEALLHAFAGMKV